MQILLTSKSVSASSLQRIFKVFYRINVSCLNEIKYTTKKQSSSLVLVLMNNDKLLKLK